VILVNAFRCSVTPVCLIIYYTISFFILSTIERNSSEYIQVSQNREMHLHRTRQLKNKSHCVTPAFSKYDDISSKEDTEEEVIYSDGEPFEGYLYPNNTWDSEDSTREEEYKVSGWI